MNRRRTSFLLHFGGFSATLLVSFSSAGAEVPPAPLTPPQEQASFHLAEEQLVIERVAAEPDVVSPVAIAWDADGRMFVAEMSDYPNSREGGRIKLLEDRDGDGLFEHATVFADQLPFPNGVLPWKNGVLATAAPDIWFLRDTNGDGVADERQKILTGFAEGNQQLRVNGLLWGLDNWIYGANGRSEGEIRWADAPGATDPPISIRGHDFRFRPGARQFEAIAGRSQFGQARDDWGNRFLSWNTIPIRHEVLPQRYLSRNRFLAVTESVCDLLEPGDDGRVHPLTPPPLTFNNESTSHFNALAGLTIYRGDGLGEKYRGNAFVGESLRNLVHRRVLEPVGPTFIARRGEQGREFLASTDPWFHPVNFATGPDGALYVVDFYRRFVEHPDFVQGRARQETPWQTGAGHGRLWRIRLKSFMPPMARRKFNLTLAGVPALVGELANPNGWWRDTAQRLLLERPDRTANSLLEKVARTSTNAAARIHALSTLDGLGVLTPESIETALKDPDPRIREHAVTLSGEWLSRPSGAAHVLALFSLEGDSAARVRFQLELALGDVNDKRTPAALARLAQRDFTNRWHALAILSSLAKSPWLFLRELVTANESWLKAPTPGQAQFLDQVAQLVGANHSGDELKECVSLIESPGTSRPAARFALLAGLGDGFARAGQPLHRLLREPLLQPADPVPALARLMQEAARAAVEPRLDVPVRLAALRFVIQARTQSVDGMVLRLLQPDQPMEIQSAAARTLGELNEGALARAVFASWDRHAIGTRRQLLGAALRSSASTTALIDALAARTVSLVELDASMRQTLRKIKDADLQSRVAPLFQNLTATDREEVVRSFQPALKLDGERARGAAIFARTCLPCHVVEGRGSPVGPELSAISSRPGEAVLVDILDPSRQVSPEFISYTMTTAKGETLSGLIATETATSITLRRQGQPDDTVLRSQVTELHAEGKSLMPDGLEQGLTHQDFADLLAFLRQPAAALLPK